MTSATSTWTRRGTRAGVAAIAACLTAGGLLTASSPGQQTPAAPPTETAGLQKGLDELVEAGAPGAILLVRNKDRTLRLDTLVWATWVARRRCEHAITSRSRA